MLSRPQPSGQRLVGPSSGPRLNARRHVPSITTTSRSELQSSRVLPRAFANTTVQGRERPIVAALHVSIAAAFANSNNLAARNSYTLQTGTLALESHRPDRSQFVRPGRTLSLLNAVSAQDTPQPTKLRTLYPSLESHDGGELAVGGGHTLYYKVYGNPKGIPAIVVHGGPGAGCYANHARFFDPKLYRILLVDQRGCGLSLPRGRLQGNNTPALVEDIERLRVHLRVDKWLLFGGSWGVCLSMAYALRYPAHVSGIVLRGVCLMRPEEIDWLYRPGGASELAPREWEDFLSAMGCAPPGCDPSDIRDPVEAAWRKMTSGTAVERDTAARAWHRWGFSVAAKRWPTQQSNASASDWPRAAGGAEVGQGTERRRRRRPKRSSHLQVHLREWRMEQERREAAGSLPQPSTESPMSGSTAQALLEAHYCMHDAFLHSRPILEEVAGSAVQGIPAVAVQGRQDLICPPRTARALARAWPALDLRIVEGSGHSMYDAGITDQLVRATDALAPVIRPSAAP